MCVHLYEPKILHIFKNITTENQHFICYDEEKTDFVPFVQERKHPEGVDWSKRQQNKKGAGEWDMRT